MTATTTMGQAWENMNDSDDENDDDDKTMIEAGNSDASLAYMALFSYLEVILFRATQFVSNSNISCASECVFSAG